MGKNYTEYLDTMREKLRTKECLVQCLEVAHSQRSWYMDSQLDENGNIVYDENGNSIKIAPEKDNSWNWQNYQAWTLVIDAIEKLIEK